MVDESAVALAIETSGRRASVTLGRGVDDVTTVEVERSRRHNLELLPAIARLFACCGIERDELGGGAVFVSLGPGSFTGLRVGVAAAQMLGVSTGCDLVGVPTLEALASNIPERLADQPVAVCLASKRGRSYATVYRGGAAIAPPANVAIDELLVREPKPTAILGEAVAEQLDRYATADHWHIERLDSSLAVVKAETVFSLGWTRWHGGETTPAARLLPIYGREPEAVRLWASRSKA